MSEVIIMVGIPGSGKSHFAKESYPNHTVYSADLYFERKEGGYLKNFNPSLLGEAHKQCMASFVKFCTETHHNTGCVVDNTNTTLVEIAPYIQVAQALDHEVKVFRMRCKPEVAHARNTHGVPLRVVQSMESRIQNMISSWPHYWPSGHIIHTSD